MGKNSELAASSILCSGRAGFLSDDGGYGESHSDAVSFAEAGAI
ncbi:MAG: hypothetical protein ACLUKN_12990 [Bacilli bacterium]